MKPIAVIVKPFKPDTVQEALTELGLQGLTATEVKGFGRRKGRTGIYRGAEHTANFLPKAKVEAAVDNARCEAAVEAIRRAAHTGRIGDGKIFVSDLGQAVRIRTGEAGADAL